MRREIPDRRFVADIVVLPCGHFPFERAIVLSAARGHKAIFRVTEIVMSALMMNYG
jgi:hypothetical protein